MLILHRKISSLSVSSVYVAPYEIDPENAVEISFQATSEPANGESYAFEETITYEITITNLTDVDLTNITITSERTEDEWLLDVLEAGQQSDVLESETIVTEQCLCDIVVNGEAPDENNPTFSSSVECISDVEEPNGHLIVQTVTVSNPANNEAYDLNEVIQYETTVVNDGNLTIANIYVTDQLTGGIWQIDSLAPGKRSPTLESSHRVKESDILADEVLNVVTARGTSPNLDEPDVLVTPGEDPEPTVDPNSSIAVSISYINPPANGTSYAVDEDVEYGLEITNNGNLTITDVELNDETSERRGTLESMPPGFSQEFGNRSCYITSTNIADGYFTIEGSVTGDSTDENNPDYSDTFTFQIPITPE